MTLPTDTTSLVVLIGFCAVLAVLGAFLVWAYNHASGLRVTISDKGATRALEIATPRGRALWPDERAQIEHCLP